MGIEYWYKKQDSTGFENITNQVLTEHQIKGSESINDLPGGFSLGITPYKKYGASTILTSIDINSGDEILVLNGLKIIAHGKVWDSGRKPIFFDRKTNKAVCEFYPKVVEPDFSDHSIDSISFEDENFSVICNELFLHSDDSIGVDGVGLYKLNFDDFRVTFSSNEKGLREMCAELAQQNDLFFIVKKQLTYLPDDDRVFIIKRYIEFNSKSGSSPSENDIWGGGITTLSFRDGTIANPITGNRFTKIAAELLPEPEEDPSQIVNSIKIDCKIFASTGLSISEISAKSNTVDYDINNYASEIVNVGIWTKDNVKILSGSTSSIVKIPSRYATTIEEGNIAFFKDSSIDFFTVNSVNKVDSIYTEIGFSPSLPFTPSAGDLFQIVGNVPIYTKEEDVNYSSTGCIVEIDPKNYAKIHFLDLSEPNPTQRFFVVYRKIVDYPIRLVDKDSIKKYGLKHKEIKLDDSIILTSLEANNLASNALQLEPKITYKVPSRRYGIAPIGMALSIRVNNLIDKVLILNNIEYELITNSDYNKQPIFLQTLEFTNQTKDVNRLIARYQKLKKNTSSTKTTLNKNIKKETISISEQIRWGRTRQGLSNPIQLDATSISDISLQLNWYLVDYATSYLVEVYLDSDLTNLLFSKEVYSDSFYLVSEEEMDGNNIFYSRVKAKNNLLLLESDWSNTKAISTQIDWDYTVDDNGFYLNFANSDLTNIMNAETATSGRQNFTSDKFCGRKGIILSDNVDEINVTNSLMDWREVIKTLTLKIQFTIDPSHDFPSNHQRKLIHRGFGYYGEYWEFSMYIVTDSSANKYINILFKNAYDYYYTVFINFYKQINFLLDTIYSLIFAVDFENKLLTLVCNSDDYSSSVLVDPSGVDFASFNQFRANMYYPIFKTNTSIGNGQDASDFWKGIIYRPEVIFHAFTLASDAIIENARFGF